MQPQPRTDRPDRTDEPTNELDLYQQTVDPTEVDQLLNELNLGLGNYSDRESWQQIQSFRNHLYAESAFAGTLLDLAVYETLWELGQEAHERADADNLDDLDADTRRQAILELGRQRWESLGEGAVTEAEWREMNADQREVLTQREQLDALEDHSGVSEHWTPPHGRMIAVRHEASRGRDARLMDNVYGRVRKILGAEPDDGADPENLGGGGL